MSETEPTLNDLLRALGRAKFHMLICAILALIAAFAFTAIATPLYKAGMIVAPADGYALGDYASSSTSFESMITLPFWRPREAENVSTDFYRFIYTSRGPSVATILLKDDSVLAGIRRDGSWLRSAKSWTPEELAEYLNARIRVEPVGATPLRRLTYSHPDPVFAAEMLRKIHLVADQMIRRDRRRQSQSRIDYLNGQLARVTQPDHRKVITNLLIQQEHVQMLANLDEAYAAIIVEPAAAGPRPAWPNPWLVFPSALLGGLLAGYVLWSARQARHG